MNLHLAFAIALTAAFLGAAPAGALEADDNRYPNSILAPEPGTPSYHRERAARHPVVPYGPATQFARRPAGKPLFARRGSSGSVLPTPLPRTPLIPPEGGGPLTIYAPPQEQGPTIVPGAQGLGAIPNLPHGPETFQDRASRCAFQQGLNNIPGTASSQYMGACVQ